MKVNQRIEADSRHRLQHGHHGSRTWTTGTCLEGLLYGLDLSCGGRASEEASRDLAHQQTCATESRIEGA